MDHDEPGAAPGNESVDRDRRFGRFALDTPYPSHLSLLRGSPAAGSPASAPASPDAIIVPAHRSPAGLAWVFGFAAALGCPLVVLWTDRGHASPPGSDRPWSPGPDRPWLAAPDSADRSTVVVCWPAVPDLPWQPTESLQVAAAARSRNLEASEKRTLGLQLARLMGWRTVLFVDDDTTDLQAADVRQAVGALGALPASTFRMTQFPDHSVVYHAARKVGANLDVLLGGALVVRVDVGVPFFPPVYNEDWLFCHDWLARRQVRYAGNLTQAEFDPFVDPERARQEEFGDLLGEGLMARLHRGERLLDVDLPFWRGVLRHRAWLLDAIEQALPVARTDPAGRLAMAACLAAARAELGRIDAGMLHEFVRAWRHDLQDWRRHLAALTPQLSTEPEAKRLQTALTTLGLGQHHLPRDSGFWSQVRQVEEVDQSSLSCPPP